MKKQLLFYSITTLLLTHGLHASDAAHHAITQLMGENAGLKILNQKLIEEQKELKAEIAKLKKTPQTVASSATAAAKVAACVQVQKTDKATSTSLELDI